MPQKAKENNHGEIARLDGRVEHEFATDGFYGADGSRAHRRARSRPTDPGDAEKEQ